MESWEGLNYYTTNSTRWVELMNLSTADWGIGFLPANVFAIPGALNESYHFSPDAIVIENASKADVGSRDIEKIIFGLASTLVILWAIGWFLYNRANNTFLSPRGARVRGPRADDHGPLAGPPVGGGGGENGNTIDLEAAHTAAAGQGFVEADEFRRLLKMYYEPTQTELELQEKGDGEGGDGDSAPVDADDVEAGTALLRKMYGVDLDLWAHQSDVDRETSDEQRQLWRDQSDAILADFRRLVDGWNSQRVLAGWSEDEVCQLQGAVDALGRIPERRYGANRQSVPGR